MRSLLFVPGDAETKMDKAMGTGADVLILDLEDSVGPAAKETARWTTASFLAHHRTQTERPRLFVRINSLDTSYWEDDLAAVMDAGPDGLVIPKATNGDDVHQLSIALDVAEARAGLAHGATQLIVLVTEVPVALLRMETFIGASPRVHALTWGAEDLSVELGATATRDGDGRLTSPFRLARDLCLIAAAAGGMGAIDTVYTNFRDHDGLKAEAEAAARDGFSGKLAIHPAQVAAINAAFTPDDDAIRQAQRIVDAFAGDDGSGVTSVDGVMLDRPHLSRARATLERARMAGRTSC